PCRGAGRDGRRVLLAALPEPAEPSPARKLDPGPDRRPGRAPARGGPGPAPGGGPPFPGGRLLRAGSGERRAPFGCPRALPLGRDGRGPCLRPAAVTAGPPNGSTSSAGGEERPD